METPISFLSTPCSDDTSFSWFGLRLSSLNLDSYSCWQLSGQTFCPTLFLFFLSYTLPFPSPFLSTFVIPFKQRNFFTQNLFHREAIHIEPFAQRSFYIELQRSFCTQRRINTQQDFAHVFFTHSKLKAESRHRSDKKNDIETLFTRNFEGMPGRGDVVMRWCGIVVMRWCWWCGDYGNCMSLWLIMVINVFHL